MSSLWPYPHHWCSKKQMKFEASNFSRSSEFNFIVKLAELQQVDSTSNLLSTSLPHLNFILVFRKMEFMSRGQRVAKLLKLVSDRRKRSGYMNFN